MPYGPQKRSEVFNIETFLSVSSLHGSWIHITIKSFKLLLVSCHVLNVAYFWGPLDSFHFVASDGFFLARIGGISILASFSRGCFALAAATCFALYVFCGILSSAFFARLFFCERSLYMTPFGTAEYVAEKNTTFSLFPSNPKQRPDKHTFQ